MIRNYFKVALRNLRRTFGYTLINVSGLAVGLTCCLLSFLYVTHESSFDRFHEKVDRIYRMANDVELSDELTRSGASPMPHGPLLAGEIAAIEQVVRLVPAPDGLVIGRGSERFDGSGYLFADSTFFDLFSFPLSRGSADAALTDPFSVVLSSETASTYFGDQDPIGEQIVAEGEHTFTVTGVLEPLPVTSHLQFDGVFSMDAARAMEATYFEDQLFLAHATYFLMRPDADATVVERQANAVVDRHFGEAYESVGVSYEVVLEPLPDVYLRSGRHGLGQMGSHANLYIVTLIALLTLVIACVNFMNLATARSVERAREVGIRRVVGGRRTQIAVQFLFESILLTLIALVLAVLISLAVLPLFNNLANTTLSLASLLSPAFALAAIGGATVIGVLAGIYPAFVLSGFQPISVLKGRFSTSSQGVKLRKSLVVIQFTIAIILIAGALVIQQQVRHMQNQNLGFRSERMLVIDFHEDADVKKRIDVIKREMLQLPGVVGATASNSLPGRPAFDALTHIESPVGETREMLVRAYPVDFDFIDQFELKMVAGRPLSRKFAATDTSEAYIINESARKQLGYASAKDAIGKEIRQWGRDGRIIGVVENFHVSSLKTEIAPLSLAIYPGTGRYLTLRLASGDLRGTVAAVQRNWERLVPQRPFDYAFLDESFQKLYTNVTRFGRLIGVFSILAIVVACLGLFGLASFTAMQRTKEIGVRKVLGASVGQIVVLLSSEVVRLVVIAFVAAVPVVYLLMRGWLRDFAYRIDMPWLTFLAAGIAALLAAAATVSYQSIRAATANPVRALRAE